MRTEGISEGALSPWWRRGVVVALAIGFALEILIAFQAYRDAPPLPGTVVDPAGQVVFTGADITAGQQVFLKYGLMENGSIWGHGAYLGPDFSARYLHEVGLDASRDAAMRRFGQDWDALSPAQRRVVATEVSGLLKENRYDPRADVLAFTQAEVRSFHRQIGLWERYFSDTAANGGLPSGYIRDAKELRDLTAFFAWTAWASIANRPGKAFSYTNNFPYDPALGNTPTSETVLWSALSLVTLLTGIALVLFAFGKFDYLGWKGSGEHVHPRMLPGAATPGQRALVKFFVAAALLFLVQVLLGGATAHYRAEPGSFYGFDLAALLPSNLLRTWHLQAAIFWIATSVVAGGLLLAQALGEKEPRGQVPAIHALFGALVVVVVGSLLGEYAGINQWLGDLWFWFGHQGWEFLDLGRAWQILLAVGLVGWVGLLLRSVLPALRDPQRREITVLFFLAALAIPVFYLPAFFFGSTTHFTVVYNWRFWIIHLWVEGFFELFVTVMVAVTFFRLGLVARQTAVRVVYLDAILFLGSGIVGTGHHWYFSGQSTLNMSLSALFSAMEVVPLTLLTLDAWDFVKLTRSRCDVCGQAVNIPHKWAFYFLMAVGFWNFVGAGVFGFLINLPIVSYFEVGTILTPNHGHLALMGVFGMEALALMTLTFRQVLPDDQWAGPEKLVRVSFWGLNSGLALMAAGSLFPGGVLQVYDVLQNGYWHARGLEYLGRDLTRLIEWARMPGDVVFIGAGVAPMVVAAILTYVRMRRAGPAATATAA
ncbi:nitric-oxide reductase large subunit [Solidesulfovibrio sp.]|uniref:nitric-oxide reductase large subunit n=1 Tax=Solidesulfovibrio sp. TaxID=2910990 RepID=UPI002B2096BC|nr:nitric-oxide reductase large subunit [Solidesulfovibrio sp.]MEA4856348.1 nitric-oxide reductase large subunit [Solidesulfovibrio sp.]